MPRGVVWLTRRNIGFVGVPAYMMQGVHAEMTKGFARSVENYILTSRIVQGNRDFSMATDGEKADILARWDSIDLDLNETSIWKRKKKAADKGPARPGTTSSSESMLSRARTGWWNSRSLSLEEKRKMLAQRRATQDAPALTPNSSSSRLPSLSDDSEFEQAIQASVRETSRGDADEDATIEAAVRESVRAMRERAAKLQALPDSADNTPEKDASIFNDEEYQISDEDYQNLIEQAVQQSLATHFANVHPNQEVGIAELAGTAVRGNDAAQGIDGQHDDDLERAIEASKNAPIPEVRDDEAELRRAIEASNEDMHRERNQRTEEDIVLEYVKKQSLAEEEYRRKMTKGKNKAVSGDGDGDDEDEELKRALEESLKTSAGHGAGPSQAKG